MILKQKFNHLCRFALKKIPLIFEYTYKIPPNTINGKNLSLHHGMGKYQF